ncbi:MAG: tRNA lysidine(34) synthetase TilS [Arcobacter sp.]|nr:MAG: tRNA lysidine(34) synthetase TilS [Arcobacter sp.]
MNIPKLEINTTKNLLAFSAGVDSTALFFFLLKENISFDIAIVDYKQRVQSKDELLYARELAHKYNKKCYISIYPDDLKFSEKSAREYRYNFFDKIIKKYTYESLITAHQLNDKLEWFLMQFTKGAGVTELIGMEKVSVQNGYKIIKPLLEYSKKELQSYLDTHNIKYFIDETNYDKKYKRNYFRHNFSDELLEQFQNGIKNSFKYLEMDNRSLFREVNETKIKDLTLFTFNGDLNIGLRLIDQDLKKRGIIISYATRNEIREKKEVVISHKVAVAIVENKIYIVPVSNKTMDKKFKEKCRINHLPKNIRPYIFELYEEKLFTF